MFGLPTRELDAMNPLSLVSGTWPSGPGEIIIDQATAATYHLSARHHGRAGGPQAPPAVPRHRDLPLRRSHRPRAHPVRRRRPRRRPAHPRQTGVLRRDRCRRPPRRLRQPARHRHPRHRSRHACGQHRHPAGPHRHRRRRRPVRAAALRAAGLRRDCPVRRLVHHLQHAVDHRRPADPGAGHPAHPRGVPPPGPRVDPGRRNDRRGGVRRDRPRGRGRRRQGPQHPARRLRHPAARRRHRRHLADRRHQPHRRDRRHPCRQRRPGAAGHADRAYRRDPGGSGTASSMRGCAASPSPPSRSSPVQARWSPRSPSAGCPLPAG